MSHRTRQNGLHDAAACGPHVAHVGCPRQQTGVVDAAHVAALFGHDLAEFLQCRAAVQRVEQDNAGIFRRDRRPCQSQHLDRERLGHRPQVCRSVPAHRLDAFAHLERIAAGIAQRSVHGREQRHDGNPCGLAERDHGARQLQPAIEFREECTAAALHVQHEARESFRQLLAHDAGGDQLNALHRRRGIAQGVEPSISGRDFRGLADQRTSDAFQLRRSPRQ